MTTMFMSPCTDHDNCLLDLKMLKAEIKMANQPDPKGEELWKEIDRLNAKRKDVVLTKEPEAIKKVDGDIKDAWANYHEWQNTQSCTYRTTLYTIRAHHRGRCHRLKERQPDGSVIALDLESQANMLANDPDWNRVLKRFLKPQVPVQTNQ